MKKLLMIIICIFGVLWSNAQEKLHIPNKISVSKADKFSGKKTYQHSVFKDQRPFILYLYGCDTARLLNIKCQYFGKDWIFFDRMLLLNDRGEKMELKFTSKDLDRTVSSGGYVYETGRRDLSYKEIVDLKKILTNTQRIDVRFIGKYRDDTVFRERKIKAALELIDFFYVDNKAIELLKRIYDLERKLEECN